MKCRGEWDIAGAGCEGCSLFMDNCDGHPDWADYNGQWLPIEEVEALVINEMAGHEARAEREV